MHIVVVLTPSLYSVYTEKPSANNSSSVGLFDFSLFWLFALNTKTVDMNVPLMAWNTSIYEKPPKGNFYAKGNYQNYKRGKVARCLRMSFLDSTWFCITTLL